MTDSILRSYQYYSQTSIVPFPAPLTGASLLLSGEAQGWAVDATDGTTTTYSGGPIGGNVSVIDTGTPANNMSNVVLDASNLLNAATIPKLVVWNTAPILRWQPHNFVTNSENASAAIVHSNDTVTVNSDVAPDGTTTADTVALTGNAYNYFDGTTPTNDQFVYTASIWLKAASNINVPVLVGNGGSTVFSGMVAITTSWVRYSWTFTCPGTGSAFQWGVDTRSGIGAGDGVAKTYVCWGAQLNRGSTPTAYIRTTSSARVGAPIEWDAAANKFGLSCESISQNFAVQSDDFTNAAWTKVNMSTAKTAIGPDDVANSATTLTATAANATALQFFSDSSIFRNTSVWLKRRTGSGNIDLTQDNGSTWTTQSVTSSWARYFLPSVTSANPTFGLRIVTNGDAVDVFCFQHERNGLVGEVAHASIQTLTGAVSKQPDQLSALTSSFPWSNTNGTVYVDYKPRTVTAAQLRYVWMAYKDANNEIYLYHIQDPIMGNIQATVTDVATDIGTLTVNTRAQASIAFATNDFDGSLDGGAALSDSAATLTTGYTKLSVGAGGTTTNELDGVIYRMIFVPRQVQTDTANLSTWRYNF